MGNYLANSFYKDGGCVPENNNGIMNAVTLPCRSKDSLIKQTSSASNVSKFISLIEISSDASIRNLQSEYENNNTYILKTIVKKLSFVPYLSKLVSSESKTSGENRQESYRNSCNENYMDTGTISVRECANSSSGSNTYAYFHKSRIQVDPDSLFFTASISMVQTQRSVNSLQEVPGTGNDTEVKHFGGISFFINLDKPYERYPLNQEYKFYVEEDCHSVSSENSFFSSECYDDADSSFYEEEFIVFAEQEDEEGSDFYEFQVPGKEGSQENSHTCLKNDSLPKCYSSLNSTDLNQSDNCPGFVREHCVKTCEKTTKAEQKNVSDIPRKTSRKVRFQTDDDLVVIYHMRYWDFAYRQARKGPWEVAAVDRCRFWRRIKDLESVISPCLQRKLQSIKKL